MQKILFPVISILILPLMVYATTITDHLIDADIGEYSKSYGGSCPKGSGVLAGAGHFKLDHIDYTCDIRYYNEALDNGVEVQVTKHGDSTDSRKWLLHELDKGFREYYGIPSLSYTPRQIDGQTVFVDAVGGRYYRWLSGNKVISIEYHGSLTQFPEPLEVIKAYLVKHPSTLPVLTLKELRSDTNKTTWIKDEMDRRLWLCDKWFYQLQLGKVQQREVFEQNVKSMNIFLDYREKYYGVKSADEKNLLAGYLNTNNGTGIKAKLDEYKKWWAVNKEKGISL